MYLHGEIGGLVAETVRLDPVLLKRLGNATKLLKVGLALLDLGELGGAFHARWRVCKLRERRYGGVHDA